MTKDKATIIGFEEELLKKAKKHCIDKSLTLKAYITGLVKEDLKKK